MQFPLDRPYHGEKTQHFIKLSSAIGKTGIPQAKLTEKWSQIEFPIFVCCFQIKTKFSAPEIIICKNIFFAYIFTKNENKAINFGSF